MLQTTVPKRRNKAFGSASNVYPSLLTGSTLKSATDGVMTRWEPNPTGSYW